MRPLAQDLAGYPDCGRKNNWVRLHRHRPVRAKDGKTSANWPGQPDRGPYEGTLAQVFKDHDDDRASGIGYVEVVTHDGRKIWWRTRDCEFVEDPGNPGTFFTFAATFGHELQQMPIVRLQGLYCNLTGGFLEVTEKYRGKMIRAVFRALDIDETEEFQNLPCAGEYEKGDDECDPCQHQHICSNVRNGVCVPNISSSIVDYADAQIRTASTAPIGSLPGPGVVVTQDLPPTSGMAFTAPTNSEACSPKDGALGRIGQSSGFERIEHGRWACPHGHEFEVPRRSRSLTAAKHANDCPVCKPQLKPLADFKETVREFSSDQVIKFYRHLFGPKKAIPKSAARAYDQIIRAARKNFERGTPLPDIREFLLGSAPVKEKPGRTWIDTNYESIAATQARGFPCWDGVPPDPPLNVEFPEPIENDPVHQQSAYADYRQGQSNAEKHARDYEEGMARHLNSAAHTEARIKQLQEELEHRRRREAMEEDPINYNDLGDWLSRPVGVPNGIPRKHKVTL